MHRQPVPSPLASSNQYKESYIELFRLTGESFASYYELLSNQSVGDSLDQLGSDFQLLLHNSPYFFTRDLGTALLGALLITLFRLFLDRVLITVSESLVALMALIWKA